MSLKKYNSCDESHSLDFQYVCLKEKKVFCIKCWFKLQHFRHCQSSRCGQYHKIAHLALNRALEYKNSKIMQNMCANHTTYQALRVKFLQLNFQVTQILKEFVQQKMPLLFWGMSNELLRGRCGSQNPQGYNKFDSYCTQMIKIIKSTDTSMKQDYLQSAIGAYFDINHQLQGQLNDIRTTQFKRPDNKEYQVNQVLEKTKRHLNELLTNIKKGMRSLMDTQLQKTTKSIDPSVKFRGVSFQKITADNQCFRKRQEYPYLNLPAQKYAKITNQEKQLHMGFHMIIESLQKNPEQLLKVSKCLIKESLHQYYQNITAVKSIFPYKYIYPISTTLSDDQEYQELMIDLERAAIDSPDRVNPFLNSLSLIIMGRDVIIIRFYNLPKFYYTRKIYNYRNDRKEYYNILTTKLGLDNTTMKSNSNQDEIEFIEELTETQLAYCNFRIAYENIFSFTGEDLIFEGEKTLANRGAAQFADLVQKWRKNAKLDLQFSLPLTQMAKQFV